MTAEPAATGDSGAHSTLTIRRRLLVFSLTVTLGAFPLLAAIGLDYINKRPHPFIDVLEGGQLFVAAAVLSAGLVGEALGNWRNHDLDFAIVAGELLDAVFSACWFAGTMASPHTGSSQVILLSAVLWVCAVLFGVATTFRVRQRVASR